MSAPIQLTDTDLAALGIGPEALADAIEDALRAKAEGRIFVSPKSALLPGGGRYMMATLAVGEFTVVKQVTVSPDNPSRGLPSINGAIMVLDAETGLLRAVLGANWITAHRTAALSAVAARRLAPKDARTIAFVGTGVQARSHLAAFLPMFPLAQVIGVGRGEANLRLLREASEKSGLSFRTADAQEALQAADIVVTSITLDYSVEPFLDARWLKPTAFAAITDLCIPWKDESLAAFGTVVVDDRAQEREAEKPMLPYEQVAGDLTELVMDGVTRAPGPAAFAFRGIALGDYAAAALAVRIAEETGAGRPLADG